MEGQPAQKRGQSFGRYCIWYDSLCQNGSYHIKISSNGVSLLLESNKHSCLGFAPDLHSQKKAKSAMYLLIYSRQSADLEMKKLESFLLPLRFPPFFCCTFFCQKICCGIFRVKNLVGDSLFFFERLVDPMIDVVMLVTSLWMLVLGTTGILL